MKTLMLNGQWKLKEADKNTVYNATVPGCNYLDLIDNNIIKDPFLSTNEKESFWVSERDWEYSRSFVLEKDFFANERILLECLMLDTLCEIYLNDELIGTSDNCHKKYESDVTDYLKIGENRILIKFLSPVYYITKKQESDPMPKNMNGLSGVPHIRKPQSHFGWDWAPTLPPSGIQGDIFLKGYNVGKINSVEILQRHSENSVWLDINPEVFIFRNTFVSFNVKITAPNGEIIEKVFDKTISVEIKNPQLWWTYELNKVDAQSLYQIEVSMISDDKVCHVISQKIGLRTIKLIRENDEIGSNFYFELNGVHLFAKGANWIPADVFVTRYQDKLEYFIKAMRHANMNMIRVWGGGFYESEKFYDLTDEYGILVWQDFPFACAPYPFYDDKFLNNILTEVEYSVKRLRHRASLALWCGNNEIEAMSTGWLAKRKLIEWTEKFFYNILPPKLREFDSVTSYIEGSPIGSAYNKEVPSDDVGDTHLWGVWHGLQPLNSYRNRFTRFCSEFGLESLPSLDAIKTFATPNDYSLKSPVFMAHQKCGSGNAKMLYYLATKYDIPRQFVDLVYFTGLIQKECVKDATEHWRRNRGRCNGSLYWQMNDCWQVSSWSSIDYLGKFKALQYEAKHFNAPIMVSLKDNKKDVEIFVVNDLMENKMLTLVYQIKDVLGRKISEKTINLEATKLSSIKVDTYIKEKDSFVNKRTYLVAMLYDGENIISKKTTLFLPEKKVKLEKVKFEQSISVSDKISVSLKPDVFARSVMIDISGINSPFNDNYIDIEANEEFVFTVDNDKNYSKEDVIANLSISTVANIDCNKSKLKNFFTRFNVAIKPMNIINIIIYKFIM